jgi:Wiskott-Aldrich syndrome protein
MSQTSSTPSSEDRRRHPYLATVLNPSTHKVLSTASARIYHKSFGASQPEWAYSKIKGLLVFSRDRNVDGNKTVIGQGYALAENWQAVSMLSLSYTNF